MGLFSRQETSNDTCFTCFSPESSRTIFTFIVPTRFNRPETRANVKLFCPNDMLKQV